MYQYYQKQDILPTYGDFKTFNDLEAYERERRSLFTEKLYLPARLFHNSQLIEFGPDAGENSLVFALWGAHCKLIEPNIKSHSFIKNYFEKFGLSHKLTGIEDLDLKAFSERPSSEKFDFIDAEGFIYTVKPESLWIDTFARLLNDRGFVILFYCETCGNFMELLLKVIHSRVRKLTGNSAIEAAHKLFNAKWKSIPHKRSIESWVMDVLENPFTRLRYFFELKSLCKKMDDAGFCLYSSWPPYNDSLDVYWFKKILKSEDHLYSVNEFIRRNRLSHMFGRKHFLLHPDPDLEEILSHLLTLTDSLIDEFDKDRAMQCIHHLSIIDKIISSNKVFAKPEDTLATRQTIQSLKQIFCLLIDGAMPELIKFCNSDQPFIKSWGTPSHFAVFSKKIL